MQTQQSTDWRPGLGPPVDNSSAADPAEARVARLLEAVELKIAAVEGPSKAGEEGQFLAEDLAVEGGSWKRARLIVDAVGDVLDLHIDRRHAIAAAARFVAGGFTGLLAGARGFATAREFAGALFGLPAEALSRDEAQLLDEAWGLCTSYAEFDRVKQTVLWCADLLRQAERLEGRRRERVAVRGLVLSRSDALFLDRLLSAERRVEICRVGEARPALVVENPALARFFAREATRPSMAAWPPGLREALAGVGEAAADYLRGRKSPVGGSALLVHDVAYLVDDERSREDLYARRAAEDPGFRCSLFVDLFGYFSLASNTAAGRSHYVEVELRHLGDGRFGEMPLVAAGLAVSLLDLCEACPELSAYRGIAAEACRCSHRAAGLESWRWERFLRRGK